MRNEVERLGTLLDALAGQDIAGLIPVVVTINNTTDGSVAQAFAAARRHVGRLALLIDDHVFEPGFAHAGSARERAMALGLERLGRDPEGVLISTDADTRPPQDWVRSNLAAITAGADLVGGRLVIDEAEPLDAGGAAIWAAWGEYWSRVRAIEDEIDPSASDPAPRHGDHTGASLAITLAAYEAAGGVPIVPTGEDRALVNAALSTGHRLVHPISVWTRVSPRFDGRAAGGMAEDMRRFLATAAEGRTPTAPGFDQWRERAIWRRQTRAQLGTAALLAAEANMPPMVHDMPLMGVAEPVGQP